MTDTSPSDLSITQLAASYAARELSPVEVLEHTIESAHRANERYNAFVFFDEDGARVAAKASEKRWAVGEANGVLDGVPVPIKDTLDVDGWPAPRDGSHLSVGSGISSTDAPVVSHLRSAGALLFARTLSSEYGWKGTGDCPLYGAARNPWDPARTPGGSSAGAGVSVAAGVTRIAHGGDGGGSIRIPANFCGVFGLKPTAHRLPSLPTTLGVLPNQGVLTATAAETAAVYDILSAPYPADSSQLPFASVHSAGSGVEGMRIGLTLDYGFPGIDQEVAAAVKSAAMLLEAAGAEIVPIEIDLTPFRTAFDTIWAAGFASMLGSLSDAQRRRSDPGLVDLIDSADRLTLLDLQRAHEAQAELSDLLRAHELEIDLMLSATSLVLPPLVGEDYPRQGGFTSWYDWAGPTWVGNLSRRPAASVPMGLSRDGLPIGVQLMGHLNGEREILRASCVIEAHAPMSTRRAALLEGSRA